MNKMEYIAKLLGVELYEKFAIEEEYGTRFRLTNTGLEISYSDENWTSCNRIFDLLTGENTIRKLPWKPKDGEYYYTPHFDKNGFVRCTFDGDDFDKFCLNHGIVFKTKEEAITLTQYLLEQVKKYREEQNNDRNML